MKRLVRDSVIQKKPGSGPEVRCLKLVTLFAVN
jgi:hypothetical protein